VSAPQETASSDPPRSLLERVDSILDAFDTDHASLTLAGLVARTGLPKTTVYRTIKKMIELRWVECHDGRFSIGTRLFERATLGRCTSLRDAAQPSQQDPARTARDDSPRRGRP